MTKKDKFKCFQAFVANQIRSGTRQTDLAHCVGCSNSTIHHLYMGNCKQFRLSWQRKIAKYFDLSLGDLIGAGEKLIYAKNQEDDQKNENTKYTKQVEQVDSDGQKRSEIHIHIHFSNSSYVTEVTS